MQSIDQSRSGWVSRCRRPPNRHTDPISLIGVCCFIEQFLGFFHFLIESWAIYLWELEKQIIVKIRQTFVELFNILVSGVGQ